MRRHTEAQVWEQPRTVHPRKLREIEVREILAVHTASGACMYRGEVFPLDELADRLHEHPPGSNQHTARWQAERIDPCLIVTDDAVRLAAVLTEAHGDDPFWQYRCDVRSTNKAIPGEPKARPDAEYLHLSFVGWASRSGELRRPTGRSRYYRILDASTFYKVRGLRVLDPYGGTNLVGLYEFAHDLQQWHAEQGLPLKYTVGSIGAALHYDPRFFDAPRRKVPRRTNDSARPTLGNYYKLVCPEDELVGHVLHPDISGAHHHAAERVCAPDPDHLYVWGNYHHLPRDGAEADDRPVAARGERLDHLLANEHGLFLVSVRVGLNFAHDPLNHPAASKPGRTFRYLYSGEVEFVRSLPGVTVDAIVAGWTAESLSPALGRQGSYCLAQLSEARPARRRWLKPALLAGYGAYATRPRAMQVGFHRSSGKLTPYLGPQGDTLIACEHRMSRNHEPATVNTIWLGLIHAWVRTETIAYARQLRTDGWRVLSIYVDGLYVEAQPGRALPPRPLWRVKEQHYNVWFMSDQQWLAATGERLPGVRGRERLRLRSEHAAMVTEYASRTAALTV